MMDRDDRDDRRARLNAEVVESILEEMCNQGMPRAELVRITKIPTARLDGILDQKSEITLRAISDITHAMHMIPSFCMEYDEDDR